uniref:C2H2-type domain-containing protein n=1 Tax=Micrurus surinamensis TaxID=129470 RepID=A0A2D4PA52_MICSU
MQRSHIYVQTTAKASLVRCPHQRQEDPLQEGSCLNASSVGEASGSVCHLKLRKRMHTGEKPHRCLESFDERASPMKCKRTHRGESLTSAPNVAKAFGPTPS